VRVTVLRRNLWATSSRKKVTHPPNLVVWRNVATSYTIELCIVYAAHVRGCWL
jgi:hypothetical protein